LGKTTAIVQDPYVVNASVTGNGLFGECNLFSVRFVVLEALVLSHAEMSTFSRKLSQPLSYFFSDRFSRYLPKCSSESNPSFSFPAFDPTNLFLLSGPGVG